MKLILPLLVLAFALYIFADSFEDLSARAAAARQANDVLQAIDLYRQALQLNGRWEEGWWFLGRLLFQRDQYVNAGDAFQHVVDLNQQAVPVWGFLGLCEFNSGDYPKALADIEHALLLGADKDPQLGPLLLFHQAALLTKKRRFRQSSSEIWAGDQAESPQHRAGRFGRYGAWASSIANSDTAQGDPAQRCGSM